LSEPTNQVAYLLSQHMKTIVSDVVDKFGYPVDSHQFSCLLFALIWPNINQVIEIIYYRFLQWKQELFRVRKFRITLC